MNFAKDGADLANLMHTGFTVDMVNAKIACLNVRLSGPMYRQSFDCLLLFSLV
jgi:hypothetical protein